MIISRWQAPVVPTPEQLKMMIHAEGLEPYVEEYNPGDKVPEHRHPFHEVRMVASGEILLDISGNKLLLRAGDRIEIPSNTRHSTTAQGSEPCVCICARRPF